MEDGYMDLTATSTFTGLSRRTLRKLVNSPVDPLPAVRIGRGKLLFRRSMVEQYLEAHRVRCLNAEQLAEEVIAQIQKERSK